MLNLVGKFSHSSEYNSPHKPPILFTKDNHNYSTISHNMDLNFDKLSPVFTTL